MSDAVNGEKIFVVAGTDTEIGKTTATCALLAAFRDGGVIVRGIKPVESGIETQCCRDDEDGRRLAKAAGQSDPVEALQRLRAPLAPPVAARDEGVELTPGAWLEQIRAYQKGVELTFVEGAGGLLSPLASGFDTRDLAVELEAPVLLVAADSLGTLNHTLLTLEALNSAGCDVAGVIFSAPEKPDPSTGRNAAVIADRLPGVSVITFPRITSDEEGAEIFDRIGFCQALRSPETS